MNDNPNVNYSGFTREQILEKHGEHAKWIDVFRDFFGEKYDEITEDAVEYILWGFTAYPASDLAYTYRQLEELRDDPRDHENDYKPLDLAAIFNHPRKIFPNNEQRKGVASAREHSRESVSRDEDVTTASSRPAD